MLGLGAAAALVVAGVAVIGALPASAAAATSITFSGLPTSTVAGATLASFTVTYSGGNGTTDTIGITSSCTLGGTVSEGATANVATFGTVSINSGTSCTLTATDTSATGFSTSSAITVDPAAPNMVIFTTAPPADGAFGAPLATFKVSVEDSYGNVETGSNTGFNDYIGITSNCTLATSPVTISAFGGVATFTDDVDISSGTSPCTLTATDSSRGLATATSAGISMVADTPTQLAFTTEPSGTPSAGVTLAPFAVSIEVSNGGLSNYTDTVTLSSSCKLTGTLSAPAVSGVATFGSVVIESSGACYITATDSSRTLPTVSSSLLEVVAGSPTHLAFVTAPPTTVNGTGIALTAFEVAVEDVYNNVETTGIGATDSILLSSTCGITGTTTETTAAGEATFTGISFTSTGTCTLTATDESRSITVATATVSVGQPQAALSIRTKTGYLDSPLTLATAGGSGTGAVTYSVTNGTATGCVITNGALSATTAGTCLVVATKAAASPYASATTGETSINVSSAPRALHLRGILTIGKKANVTISGYNFSGRPRAISNVAGFSAVVVHDTGKLLTLRVTVKPSATRPGVKTMTLVFANGKRTSFKYSLH